MLLNKDTVLKAHGRKCKAVIGHMTLMGAISIQNGSVFLVHNEPTYAGATPMNRLGYIYGYALGTTGGLNLSGFTITLLPFSTEEREKFKDWSKHDFLKGPEKDQFITIVEALGAIVFYIEEKDGPLKFSTIDTLYSAGFRIDTPPLEPVKLTKKQIAEKFGIYEEQINLVDEPEKKPKAKRATAKEEEKPL